MLITKIKNRQGGIALYGLTPPKLGTPPEKLEEIAKRQIHRARSIEADGLILYDLQDESSRTEVERPFPYVETWNPQQYSGDYLQDLKIPKIIYRSVGKYSERELADFLKQQTEENQNAAVFVGAPSSREKIKLNIEEAYKLRNSQYPQALLGGVVIPERHVKKQDEHIRVLKKIERGCGFFISQGVYDSQASLNFLSDYYYESLTRKIPLVPIIFTFTPCGSPKTLEFMKWLGIQIPRWLENELLHSGDILRSSTELCIKNWKALYRFAKSKKIPIGFNVESVAIRKVEIEASLELFRLLKETK